jgi:hypothetical protein
VKDISVSVFNSRGQLFTTQRKWKTHVCLLSIHRFCLPKDLKDSAASCWRKTVSFHVKFPSVFATRQVDTIQIINFVRHVGYSSASLAFKQATNINEEYVGLCASNVCRIKQKYLHYGSKSVFAFAKNHSKTQFHRNGLLATVCTNFQEGQNYE